MKKEGIDFSQALRLLAEKTGVLLVSHEKQNDADANRRARLIQANEAAAAYYHHLLASSSGKKAFAYLREREISEQTIRDFQIGYSKDNFEDVEKQPDLQGFILDIFLLLTAKKANMKIVSSYCIFDMKSSTIGTGGNLIKTAYRMGWEVLTLKRRYKNAVNSIE